MIAVDNFSLQYGSAKRESDEDSPNKNIPIFTFVNFYELVRFIGYAKYINKNEKKSSSAAKPVSIPQWPHRSIEVLKISIAFTKDLLKKSSDLGKLAFC